MGQGNGEPKTSPRRVAVAMRRTEAIKLRVAGLSHDQIAERLGYPSRQHVIVDIQRALAANVSEAAEELRVLELARLDESWQRLHDARNVVLRVLARRHVIVSNGRVVFLADEPIEDDGPILQAIDRLSHIEDRFLRIQERRAKYCGLDAPKQVELVTTDAVDAEIKRLTAELAAGPAGGDVDDDIADLVGTEAGETAGTEDTSG